MSFNVQTGEGYHVTCTHGNLIRDLGDATHVVTKRKPNCGCREVEICAGCSKEDCDGCPCGTSMTVKEKDCD